MVKAGCDRTYIVRTTMASYSQVLSKKNQDIALIVGIIRAW